MSYPVIYSFSGCQKISKTLLETPNPTKKIPIQNQLSKFEFWNSKSTPHHSFEVLSHQPKIHFMNPYLVDDTPPPPNPYLVNSNFKNFNSNLFCISISFPIFPPSNSSKIQIQFKTIKILAYGVTVSNPENFVSSNIKSGLYSILFKSSKYPPNKSMENKRRHCFTRATSLPFSRSGPHGLPSLSLFFPFSVSFRVQGSRNFWFTYSYIRGYR